jgi:hypothetical protein
MKKFIIIIFLAWFATGSILAQDSTESKPCVSNNKSLLGYWILKDSKPIVNPYEAGRVIDNQSSLTPSAKTLEFVIQHRFGSMEKGLSDFIGIYGSANTRLGMNYAITDWAEVGLGTTKNYKLQDASLKINILKQSKDKKSPLDVTYYGNLSVDARDDSYFGADYKFANRLAYFNELLVTRKFCDWFTMSLGGSFTHFNQVDSTLKMDHDKIALHVLGRIKFSPQSSVIINCDIPLNISGISEWESFTNPSKYNFGIGYEVATATHTFQVFASSGQFLVPQYNVMMNQNEFFKGTKYIFIGFNITRQWNF